MTPKWPVRYLSDGNWSQGAFPQEGIADVVRSRTEAEIAHHTAELQPVAMNVYSVPPSRAEVV